MSISGVLWLSLTLVAFSAAADYTRMVTTSGALLGRSHGSVREFLGVPYASKPVRFLPAEPLASTPGDRDATHYGPTCIQPPHLKEVISPLLDTDQTAMSEDCLNLNIYVPEQDSSATLPIAVWIPGEGFDYANANQFNGSYLARQGNLIVITVNYRVSVFGFLSSLSGEAPGNVGLLDQQLALKWVRQNAASLGGDPDRITVLGRFSGSMSLSAQLASPRNRIVPRLFSGAILQSGIATGPWVIDDDPLSTLSEMASAAGCPPESPLPCLKEMPADELLQKSLAVSRRFRPVIDGQFLVEDPLESFRHGRVMDADIILGANSDEGSLCLLSLYYLNSTFYRKVVDDQLSLSEFGDLISSALEDFTKRPADSLVRHLATHEYSHQQGASNTSFRDSYIKFCGSMYITAQVEQAARYLSESHRVFLYEFDHRPSFSIQPEFLRGAAHGDDVLFALGLLPRLNTSAPEEERRLSDILVESISSFAKTGVPSFGTQESSFEWPLYTPANRQVLHLTLSPSARHTRHDREVSFWQSVIPSVTSTFSREGCPPGVSTTSFRTNITVDYIVESIMTVQTTGYVLLTLACLTLLLVTMIVAAPHFLHRASANRKDSMLADLVY